MTLLSVRVIRLQISSLQSPCEPLAVPRGFPRPLHEEPRVFVAARGGQSPGVTRHAGEAECALHTQRALDHVTEAGPQRHHDQRREQQQMRRRFLSKLLRKDPANVPLPSSLAVKESRNVSFARKNCDYFFRLRFSCSACSVSRFCRATCRSGFRSIAFRNRRSASAGLP